MKQNTISQQEFDAAQAADTKAQADWKSAQENADEENSKVDEAEHATGRRGRGSRTWRCRNGQEAQTNVAAAQLDLVLHQNFRAVRRARHAQGGRDRAITCRSGQQFMSIVPTEVWVVANFKESQLKKMRTGQPVLVEIDALGGRKFRAHVDSIQAGSGAAFSLLPPENATGNYVKVVQRVPVKILFDEAAACRPHDRPGPVRDAETFRWVHSLCRIG